jgi:acyl-coenzyme A thioesterase PaaI-like protein
MPKSEPKPNTHLAVDHRLCGHVREIGSDRSAVELLLLEEMRTDATGLVHGGFIFGAADYAAMLAVNDPNVVLGSAEVRFKRPSRVGESLVFDARVESADGRKRTVSVAGKNAAGAEVFAGRFVCFVLDEHALKASA